MLHDLWTKNALATVVYTVATGLARPYIHSRRATVRHVARCVLHPVLIEPPAEEAKARIRCQGWLPTIVVVGADAGWLLG